MTFQQLRYLLEVYRTGSISKAAENLFVTRPSVSFSISSLETELGYPIFVRTQRGLVPSPRGELVLEYAERICETHQLISNIGKEKSKDLKISTVSYQPINNAIIRILEENKTATDLSFSVNTHRGKAFHKLSMLELDCVLTAPFTINKSYVQTYLTNHNLQWSELKEIPVYICIGPGHRLYNKENILPTDFERDTLLDTPTRALSRCTLLKDIVKFNGEKDIATDHATTLNYEILEKGLAYKICHRPADSMIQQHKLRCIPLAGVSQQLMLVTNPMRPMHAEIDRFINIVKEELESFDDPLPTKNDK